MEIYTRVLEASKLSPALQTSMMLLRRELAFSFWFLIEPIFIHVLMSVPVVAKINIWFDCKRLLADRVPSTRREIEPTEYIMNTDISCLYINLYINLHRDKTKRVDNVNYTFVISAIHVKILLRKVISFRTNEMRGASFIREISRSFEQPWDSMEITSTHYYLGLFLEERNTQHICTYLLNIISHNLIYKIAVLKSYSTRCIRIISKYQF